ncbi:MAG: hypothetical protein J7L54_02300 [Elusimicrobia bacterium]|nr:hypothetical protein [Elusimicrobiota bacterium]
MGKEGSKKGFTYIEIILAIAIIAYVSLGFTQTLLNNIKSAKTFEYKTLAYNKVVNWIENNRDNYDSLTPLASWEVAETGTLVSGGPSYTLKKKITLSSLGEKGQYKKIEVKINWTERGGEKEVYFATLKAKYD